MSIVITGNPGVGKHTTAELFIENVPDCHLVDINKVAIENGLAEKTIEGFEVDTTRVKNTIHKHMTKNSVVVGHLAPYVINESDINFVIVLRKNPYQLIEIYKQRGYDELKIKQNVGSEILGVIANDSIASFGKDKTFEIDTTNRSPEEVVKVINELIDEKSIQKGDIIDWLTLVEGKNELDRFFDY